MRSRVTVPEPLVGAARDYLNRPRPPVRPRDAATVVLLRDGVDGIEVYLLRRQPTMAFAAGMTVFPGGGVDVRDADVSLRWSGPAPGWWAQRFGCAEELARALVCAAVRETYEESGVLLAGPDPDTVVPDTSGEDWEADRLALLERSVSLAQLLAQRGLLLRADLLGAWAHWITPVFEPRRYDTRFFVAALPAGQRTRHVCGEALSVTWLAPGQALRRADSGTLAMLPPTYQTCRELVGLRTTAAALGAATRRDIAPIEPRLVVEGESLLLDAGPL